MAKQRDQLIKRLQKRLGGATADMVDPSRQFKGHLEPVVEPESDEEKTWEEKVEANLENHYEMTKGLKKGNEDEDGYLIGPAPKFANYVELDDPSVAPSASVWYRQPIFDDLSADGESESEAENVEDQESSSSSGEDEEEDIGDEQITVSEMNKQKTTTDEETNPTESEPLRGQSKKDFTAQTFALAKQISTKHGKTQLINSSFNRYMHGIEEGLPAWFTEDEAKYNRPMVPVTRDEVAEYKAQIKEINETDTKRALEARARKRTKLLQKTKAAQEKVDQIAEKEGLNERSKLRLMDRITNMALKESHPKPTLVIGQHRDHGSLNMPKHAKGSKLIFVDKRSKKDLRAKKAAEKRPKGVKKVKKSKYIHKKH